MVFGNSSSTASTAFADAFHVADALKSAGFSDVALHRDQSGADLGAVLDDSLGSANVMIYFAGDAAGTAIMGVDGTTTDIESYLDRLAKAGTSQVVLLFEICFAGTRVSDLTLPDTSRMDVFAVTSGDCTDARITDLIVNRAGASTLQQVLSDAVILADSGAQITLAEAVPQQMITNVDMGGVEFPTRISNDVVSILPMAAPVTIQPAGFDHTVVSSTQQVNIQPSGQTQVILPAPTTPQPAAFPQPAGLPEPSIIVGIIAGQNNFDTVDPNPPDILASEISYDDLEARRAFRDQNPALFESLVVSGAFDPATPELAIALQTELARMNCYRSRIDGDWGNISRQAVDRYFARANGTAVSRDANAELFRQVILQDGIRCPTPVVAQPSRATTRSPSSGQTRQPQVQPRQPTRQPQPQTAPSGGGGLGDVNLGGVFRG